MTLKSIKEYVAAILDRYHKASKEEKGKILDEFEKVTGYHRKAIIRLLIKQVKPGRDRRGRPAVYKKVLEPLKAIWEASDRLCSKRLQPFIPEMIQVLRSSRELSIDAVTENDLIRLSSATIDRMLSPYRNAGGRKSQSTTQPGNLLKSSIPIRTFADWQENKSGFLEIDLVAHCGDSVEGFYLNTLCAVDVASGWTECVPVWGKGQERVKGAVHQVRQRLPFPLLGLDSDNGSEFINQCFYSYCSNNKITFTKSRAYKKNDSCYVEQKNRNVVRRIVGYERYTSKAGFQCLDRLYYLVRLYQNFFQPNMKLLSKARHGAKVYKVYDTARTPYRRILEMNIMSKANKEELASIYKGLSPIKLRNQINSTLEQLWKLSDRSVASVTRILRQQGDSR